MYSIVLMMALSSGADVPAADANHGHVAYRHRHDCYCYGCHCYGCYCYGCHCYGCHCYGGHGCHHYCYGCYCYGYSCYYNYCYCPCYGYGGGHPGGVQQPPAPGPEKGGERVPPPTKIGGIAAPATVVVSLPAEAKLSIDGAATTSASDRRVFISPKLEPGKSYRYMLTGELLRDGRMITASKEVEVRAGEETRVSLEFVDRVASR